MVVFFFYHYKLSVLTFIAYLTLSSIKQDAQDFPNTSNSNLGIENVNMNVN